MNEKKQWLIRIKVGEEVIRRHCSESKDADEKTLREAAAKTAADEGYTSRPCEYYYFLTTHFRQESALDRNVVYL